MNSERKQVLITSLIAHGIKSLLELGLQSAVLLSILGLTEKLTTRECWYLGLLALALGYAFGIPYQLGVLHKIGLCSDTLATTIYRSTHSDTLAAGVPILAGWALAPFNPVDSTTFGLALMGHDSRLAAANLTAKAITGFSSMLITNGTLLYSNDKIELMGARSSTDQSISLRN